MQAQPSGQYATMAELRGAVVRACDQIPAPKLVRAHAGIVKRCQACILAEGDTFEEKRKRGHEYEGLADDAQDDDDADAPEPTGHMYESEEDYP